MRFRYFTSGQQSIFLYKYEETGGDTPSLTANDLALTGNTNLSFDLYNNASAQTISYTTSSTGAVTVSESEYITTTVNNGTITVTPVKVTPSAQTITVSQAADATYAAGSATFTVTITNSALDYATLPFSFDGSDVTNVAGLTSEGLGSYSSSPRLKFDNTDDYLTLKINETPGKLTFDIKGNGFSGGTFKVQTSADGTTYTDLETYTELGTTTQSEEFNLASSVRFIKWIYTNKSNGNVALGNINLAKPSTDPFIEVAQTEVTATADGANGTIAVTYNNFPEEIIADVAFYEADGETTASYDWLEAEVNTDKNLYYVIGANSGEARTAYMKVYALDDETNEVYSELITISQAAYVAPGTTDDYELFSGELVEGDYLIFYDGKAMNTTVTNDRLQYEEVTATDDVITTDNAAIVWHIAPSGEYWTIYNADADAYAASTGAKNKAQMLADGTDDKALWTVSGTETYEFVNKQNAASSVNANLRNNGTYGFACYATTTGGALSLYKKVEATPEYVTVSISDAGYATYVAADNVSFPADVTAYIVSDVTTSSIKLTEVLAVEKDVPVVVKGTAGTHDLEVVTAEDCDDVTENKLLVSDGTVSDNILVLANKSNGVGFYTWAGGNLPAGKVYLVNPNSSREFFGFDEGVATSISTIDNRQLTMDNAYNLQGQKVGSEYKGIIIVNGKKFINK